MPSAPAGAEWEPTVPSMASISVGSDHACGVKTDGSLICWGSNEDEDGEFVGKASPPAGSFVSVSDRAVPHLRHPNGRHGRLLGLRGE